MIEVSAPSNIALIKYMGKSQVNSNIPTNPSLSYTLNGLLTSVRISTLETGRDDWKPLSREGFGVELSEFGKLRFLTFLKVLKDEFNIKDSLLVESGNNFPSDCGLASSASSFAALTMGAYAYSIDQGLIEDELSLEDLSRMSQRGSGSSCRSFFSPFSIWENEGARPIDLGIHGFKHFALIFEGDRKEVSSSKAHLEVLSSLNFLGRPERASERLTQLIESFREGDWLQSFEICWTEFWDMHALFETSRPSFGYLNGSGVFCLNEIRRMWKDFGDGPLVTMDAGPNIHLLFRMDDESSVEKWIPHLKDEFPEMSVVES